MDLPLLARICETPGAPGFEQAIRALICEAVEGIADEVQVDNMGNVYALKRGQTSKKVMVAAHMDEIGFLVTHIDDKGFIRFHPLGGFDPKTLTAQRVIVHGRKDILGVMAAKPVHVMTPEERKAPVQIRDYFIDTGLPEEQVKQFVAPGDPITRERQLVEMGDCVNAKSLDNRLSVFILIETLRRLQHRAIPYDLYGVFTVQEEVGRRGAKVAALKVAPDFGWGIDTTVAFDLPGASDREKITQLGEGAAIKIMDAGVICDYRMVQFMQQTARSHHIRWQSEILTAGSTDTAEIQSMVKGGAIAGAVSIPTRHLHQVVEMAHKEDIQSAIDLLVACIAELDTYDWAFR